jgi:cysteine protease ATG4
MILVPLVLGASKYVNEKYIPQLREVLQWPQSIGIVGGRPSSSLYFVGCQDDNVLYLDPHEVQDVTSQPGDPSTYWCTTPRMMPLASVDPSLALGFYCGSLESAQDLCQRLAALEQQYPSAPLLNTAAGHAPPQWPVRKDSTPIDLDADDNLGMEAHAANEWELL